MGELIVLCVLICLGYSIGSLVEKRHYLNIEKREANLLYIPVVTSKNALADGAVVETAELVYANVVVSHDYFKMILAQLRNILGGEVASYETIIDRGRREALLRIKEKAPFADIILNTRLETSKAGFAGSVEILAYGTAVYYKK